MAQDIRRLSDFELSEEAREFFNHLFGPDWPDVTVGEVLDKRESLRDEIALLQSGLDQLEAERAELRAEDKEVEESN